MATRTDDEVTYSEAVDAAREASGWPARVYLAARYSRNDEMRGVRDVLAALFGIEVTSRWIDLHGGTAPESFKPDQLATDPAACWKNGLADVEDLRAADTMISFTEAGGGGKGGRHAEYGMALALGKRLVIVGPREHVFHTCPDAEWYPDWSRLVIAWSGSPCGGRGMGHD